MDALLALPRGLDRRSLARDDIDTVVALANACERHDVGFTMWERGDLDSDFRIDGVDPAHDTVGVFRADELVGWAFLPNDRGAWVDVHPDVRRLGIGTWLRGWTEDRARQRSATRVGQTINDRAANSIELLVAAGYTPRRTSWIMSMEHSERPADPVPPDGITLRTYRPGDEDEALSMFEAGFDEWPDRYPSTLATWRAMTIEREGFTPEDLVLALDGDLIVGGAFLIDSDEIWVDKLAVRRDHRGRGIARMLLEVAFQRGFDRGHAATALSTDSNTGARTLYEKVGMRVRESYTHHAIDL
jgi:GNAT superfamily N-acetyltransferase